MFQNKVVLITGASSGIGAATAVIFAREGAALVITGRNGAQLNITAKKCTEVGKTPLVIKADLTNDAETAAIIDKTIKQYGKLDILINNAGIFRYSPVEDPNYVGIYETVFNSNVKPVIVLTNLAVPYLIKTKGNIVNVSSVLGTMHLPGYSVYCASKAALIQLSKTLASELAGKGIRVNTVSPGPVDTHLFDQAGTEISQNYLVSSTAMNRISQPEEIGEYIAYVASDKAISITGSNLLIDSGCSVKQVKIS